ncbi:apolipoprotein N-acyltransferase [Loktanella sp. S4079]|uniref:apolipoprotein N-acyltransferase n=1 Tax=Loktanella sp. S4079 TaxID=579483 RepID=UPI00061F3F94|nr:apolipoprotein N-acyltransferase [Loktanella sp. S4079]KJZ20640.1 acyltransferase [Loktanella sp. S4079]
MGAILARSAVYRRVALAVLGGLAGFGQAPHDLWYITVLALAAFLAVQSKASTSRTIAWNAWAFGAGYFAFSLRWIIEPFLVDIARHGWMAPFAIVLMAAGAGLFWAVFSYLGARIIRRAELATCVGLIWAEIVRSLVFTGFPWALLGHVWIDTGLVHIATIGGPHLLTLATVSIAWAVYALSTGMWRSAVAILALWAVLAFIMVPPPQTTDDGPIIRLVQPNAPQHQKWDPAYRDMFLNRMVSMTGDGAVPDLIVWPETAVPFLLNYVQSDLSLLDEAARGAPLVFGIQRRDEMQRYFNSLVVMGAGGTVHDVYDKRHLVPFGEYIPGGELLGRFGIRGLATTDGNGFASGTGTPMVTVPGIGNALPLICYEGIFAEEVTTFPERPRMLLLITNDAWFGQAAGPYQHLAQARLRAVEQGLPMVRVANTGVSAMIDPYGRIGAAIPLNTHDAIDVPLPDALEATIYARWGDWLVFLVNALLTLGLYLKFHRDRD